MTENPPTEDDRPTQPRETAKPAAEIDFALLTKLFLRALAWYDLTERELLVSVKMLQLSFCREQVFAWVQFQTDLAAMIGRDRSKVNEVLTELRELRVLAVTKVWDGWLITPLPPSGVVGWGRRSRFKCGGDELRARQIEAELARVRWPQQMELLAPEVDFEMQEALVIATLEDILLKEHRRAAQEIACGAFQFPVTDRLPTPGPARQKALSTSEGLTRPRGTGYSGETSPSCTPETFEARENRGAALTREGEDAAPGSAPALTEAMSGRVEPRPLSEQVFPNWERAAESGTGGVPNSGTHINVLNASMLSDREHSGINALMRCSQKRNSRQIPKWEELPPLDAGAGENEMLDWLRWALGCDVMDGDPEKPEAKCYGGWWRTMIRNHRGEVMDECQSLRLRVRDKHAPPLKNRGGTMKYNILKARKQRV